VLISVWNPQKPSNASQCQIGFKGTPTLTIFTITQEESYESTTKEGINSIKAKDLGQTHSKKLTVYAQVLV
jgi:hypothetical protein